MLDHVPSPYGPREVDVTGEPKHWPCGTGIETAKPQPCGCEASGCGAPLGRLHMRTHPALRAFCARHRRLANVRLYEGVAAEVVAARLRAGARPGRPSGSA